MRSFQLGQVWYDDVRNVTYRNVVMDDCSAGPRIKGRRQGNATVSDITFENVSGSALDTGAPLCSSVHHVVIFFVMLV